MHPLCWGVPLAGVQCEAEGAALSPGLCETPPGRKFFPAALQTGDIHVSLAIMDGRAGVQPMASFSLIWLNFVCSRAP